MDGGRVPFLPVSLASSASPPDQRYYRPIRLPPTFGPFHEDTAYRTYLVPGCAPGWGGVRQVPGVAFRPCRSENPAGARFPETQFAPCRSKVLPRSRVLSSPNARGFDLQTLPSRGPYVSAWSFARSAFAVLCPAGSQGSVSLRLAAVATQLLVVAGAGLPPAGHTCLSGRAGVLAVFLPLDDGASSSSGSRGGARASP